MDAVKIEKLVKDFFAFSDEEKKALAIIMGGSMFVGGGGGVLEFLGLINAYANLTRNEHRQVYADGPYFTDDIYIDLEYKEFIAFFNSDKLKAWKVGLLVSDKESKEIVICVCYLYTTMKLCKEKDIRQTILDHGDLKERRQKDTELDKALSAIEPLLI
ncbi:hypothetical protein ACFL29_01495 [Patescibacteria group bacterium]